MSHTIKAYKNYLLNFLFIKLNIQGHVAFHGVLCSPYFLSKSVETWQNIHGINFWSIRKITNTHPKKPFKLIEKHVQFLWSGWKQEIYVQTNYIQNHQFSKGISSLTLIAGILLIGRKRQDNQSWIIAKIIYKCWISYFLIFHHRPVQPLTWIYLTDPWLLWLLPIPLHLECTLHCTCIFEQHLLSLCSSMLSQAHCL